jgi:peptide-methionine (S)-S-oxide reductase
MTMQPSEHTITLGGGCFWCLEAVFTRLRGVLSVESGYSNGQGSAPSYEQVCSGTTGHVEVVQLRFDPQQVSLEEILRVFFHVHDPTTLNRQGADIGSQYRSGIYYSDEIQHAVARKVLGEAQQAHGGAVVTELVPLAGYVRAEDYHQRYFERNPGAGYCAFVVAPKVEKFAASFRSLLKEAG